MNNVGNLVTVELVNGRIISGTVLTVDEQCVCIETNAGIATIPLDSLQIIWEPSKASPTEGSMARLAEELEDSIKAELGCFGPRYSCKQQYVGHPPGGGPGKKPPQGCGGFKVFCEPKEPPQSEGDPSCCAGPQHTCMGEYQQPCVCAYQQPCLFQHNQPCSYNYQQPCPGGYQQSCSCDYQQPCPGGYQQSCPCNYQQPCLGGYQQPCVAAYQQPCGPFPYNPNQCFSSSGYVCTVQYSDTVCPAPGTPPGIAPVSNPTIMMGLSVPEDAAADKKKEGSNTPEDKE